MAKEDEDVLKANEGARTAEIPALKKKERRKAGVAWGGGAPGANTFTGARAAASAAGAGTAAAVPGASTLAAGGGWLASLLAGKAAALGAALVLGGAGLLGYAYWRSGAASRAGSTGVAALGGLTSSVSTRGDAASRRVAVAGGGDLRFEGDAPAAKPAQPAPAAEEAPDKAADGESAFEDDRPSLDGVTAQDRLAHNLSGAKLSSNLGRQFGGKDIFAGGNSLAPRFDAGASRVAAPTLGAKAGRSRAMRGGVASRAAARHLAKGKTGRALGQLTLAKGLSVRGAQAGSAATAATAAGDAFDQQQSNGGALAPIQGGLAPNASVTPPGGGGPPDTSLPPPAVTPTSTQVDPGIQNTMDEIGRTANKAGKTKKDGQMLLLLGLAMMAAGAFLLKPPTTPWGIALLAAGALMLFLAKMMMDQAEKLAKMAEQMGQSVSQQVGQYQGRVVDYCTQQALAGQPVENCQPPESATGAQQFHQQDEQALERQKKAADPGPITFDGAGGGGAKPPQ